MNKTELNINGKRNYDISLDIVSEYFRENEIKNLMDYGCDTDEGLYKLSDMYREIMNKFDMQYFNVNTRDKEGSDGKYITTIAFEPETEIEIETSAWDGIKAITENVVSIYENYKVFYENSIKNGVQNDTEINYDYE